MRNRIELKITNHNSENYYELEKDDLKDVESFKNAIVRHNDSYHCDFDSCDLYVNGREFATGLIYTGINCDNGWEHKDGYYFCDLYAEPDEFWKELNLEDEEEALQWETFFDAQEELEHLYNRLIKL